MAVQDGLQDLSAGGELLQRARVGVLDDGLPLGEREHVDEKHRVVVAGGLDKDDVGAVVALAVGGEPRPEAAVDQGAERLAHDRGQAAVHELAAAHHAALHAPDGVHRHDGVDADHELGAAVQRHARVDGLVQHAVHVVPPVDLHRRVQPRQRRRGLDGGGDGHLRQRPLAKADGLARVEVGGDDDEVVGEVAEVVGPAVLGEEPPEVVPERGVVEDAHRDGPAQPLNEGGHEGVRPRLPHGVRQRAHHQAGDRGEAGADLAGRGREEQLGPEGLLARLAVDHGAAHLRRGDPVGEAGAHERARAHAHRHGHVVEVHAGKRVVQCAEDAHLVDGALGAAAGEGEAEAPGGLAGGGGDVHG